MMGVTIHDRFNVPKIQFISNSDYHGTLASIDEFDTSQDLHGLPLLLAPGDKLAIFPLMLEHCQGQYPFFDTEALCFTS